MSLQAPKRMFQVLLLLPSLQHPKFRAMSNERAENSQQDGAFYYDGRRNGKAYAETIKIEPIAKK